MRSPCMPLREPTLKLTVYTYSNISLSSCTYLYLKHTTFTHANLGATARLAEYDTSLENNGYPKKNGNARHCAYKFKSLLHKKKIHQFQGFNILTTRTTELIYVVLNPSSTDPLGIFNFQQCFTTVQTNYLIVKHVTYLCG